MTALARERTTRGAKLSRGTYTVAAAVTIFKGALVCLNSSGLAIPGTTVAGGAVAAVGKATHTALASTEVEVEFGAFQWENSAAGDAIAADDVTKVAFVVDDQTVALTDGGGAARIIAGVITEVRDGKPYIDMSPTVFRTATS